MELLLPENVTKRLQLLLLLTNTIFAPATICEVSRETPITIVTPETKTTVPPETKTTPIVNETTEMQTHNSLLDVPDSLRDMIFAFVPQDYIQVRGVAKRFHDKRLLNCELVNALEHYYLTSLNDIFKSEEKEMKYTTRIHFDDWVMTHAMRCSLIIKDVGQFLKEKLYIFGSETERLKQRGRFIMHLCCAVTYYCATPYPLVVPGHLCDAEHEKLSTAFLYGVRGKCKGFLKLELSGLITPTTCAMWIKKPVWNAVSMSGCSLNDECIDILSRQCLEDLDISYNHLTDASIDTLIQCYKKNKTKFWLAGNHFTTNGKMRLMRAIQEDKLEF